VPTHVLHIDCMPLTWMMGGVCDAVGVVSVVSVVDMVCARFCNSSLTTPLHTDCTTYCTTYLSRHIKIRDFHLAEVSQQNFKGRWEGAG
jgi:hypothetical protein